MWLKRFWKRNKKHRVGFRHFMPFTKKEKNVAQAANKIWASQDGGAVVERTVRKWFSRF